MVKQQQVNKQPRIARIVDGPLLPSMEGATQRFTNLTYHLAHMGYHMVMYHVYRGWSDLELLRRQPYKTYFMEPDKFYEDFGRVIDLLRTEEINIIQFSDYDRILAYGPYIRQIPDIKISYEAHDVITDFLVSLGRPESEVERARENLLKALSMCDDVTCFTEHDRQQLLTFGVPEDRLSIVPCGTDPGRIHYTGTQALNQKKILFLGNLYHEPNRIGLRDARRIIMPQVLAAIPDAKLLVVGDAPADLAAELEQDPNVIYRGAVQDLNTVFAETSVAISPITTGSGVRIKVLDYVTAGLPVVTTEMGVKGMLIHEGVIFENDMERFAEQVTRLLLPENRLEVEALSERARMDAQALTWEQIARIAGPLYERLLELDPLVQSETESSVPSERIDEPYFLKDFLKHGRFKDKQPVFKDYEYGVCQNGALTVL